MNTNNCSESLQNKYVEEPMLITLGQACKILNIGRNTMLKVVNASGFPALKLQRKNISG